MYKIMIGVASREREIEMRATGLPASLASRPLGVLRPRDARDVYTQPSVQFHRLVGRGILHRVCPGYYAIVPSGRVGSFWMPDLEVVAAGIGAADFGAERCALMGISAARVHGAMPRATGLATVAGPRRRERVSLVDRPATVRFFLRDINDLDVRSHGIGDASYLVTTPEQTALDIAHSPRLAGGEDEAAEAIRGLAPMCDLRVLARLAQEQHRAAALRRVEGGWER
jgi:predicted transcriptional regulator of viral defense system